MKMINIDDIEVSSKLNYFINDAVEKGYKDYNDKKNKKYRSILVATVTFIIVITVSHSEFVRASVEKIINTIGDFTINYKYSIPEEEKKMIGDTIEDKKIKVTLNECYVDNNILLFTTNLDSKERYDYAQEIEPSISINGKLIDNYKNNYKGIPMHNDDGTVDILSSISLDNLDISQDLSITIDYSRITVTNIFDSNKEVSGNWKYNFTIHKSEINNHVIAKEINQTIKVEDQKLGIMNIKVFPYRIVLTTNGFKNISMVRYILKDDKGIEYEEEDGRVVKGIKKSNYSLDTKNIKSITIIPRTDFHNGEPIMNYDRAITIDIR